MKYKLYDGECFMAQGSIDYIEEVIEELTRAGSGYDFIIKPKNFLSIRK